MQDHTSKPTASKFLEGFVILLCGMDEENQPKAKEAVARYGGKCVDKYTNAVTCGIIVRVGSGGFKDMLNAKVRLLTFKWLQDCILSRSLVPMDKPQYKVNIFTGLNVVCTQLTLDERTRVQQLVESGGGTFSDKLIGNLCTHLIAKTPEGEKYVGAKKLGFVKIVVMAWAEECAKQKVWVPELEFSVDILARQALREAQARKNKLQQAAIAAAAAAAQPGKNSSSGGEELSLVEQMENCLLKELAAGGRGLPDCRRVWGVQGEVFTQEIFWVQGYSREATDYATACILAGGGLRSMVLCDAVTTVLLGPKAQGSEWTLVRRHPCGVAQVNLVWLVECLFGLEALVALFREKAPLQDFLRGVSVLTRQVEDGAWVEQGKNAHAAVASMEELSAAYEAYLLRKKLSVPAATEPVGRTLATTSAMAVAGRVESTDSVRELITGSGPAVAIEGGVANNGTVSRETRGAEVTTQLTEATNSVTRKRRKT